MFIAVIFLKEKLRAEDLFGRLFSKHLITTFSPLHNSGFPASGKVRENFFSGKSGNFVEGHGTSGKFALTEAN